MAKKSKAKKSKPKVGSGGRLLPHESIAWSAIAKHADKEAERSTLPVGQHAVKLTVAGTIGRRKFSAPIEGSLGVGPPGTNTPSASAKPERVVAWLLGELCEDDDERRAVLNKLPASKSQLGELPADEVQQAAEMLKRLNTRRQPKPCYGAVKFTPAS